MTFYVTQAISNGITPFKGVLISICCLDVGAVLCSVIST